MPGGRKSTHTLTVAGVVAVLISSGSVGAVADTSSVPPSAIEDVLTASPAAESSAAPEATQLSSIEGNTVSVSGSVEVAVTLPVSEGADSEVDHGIVALSDESSSSIVPVILEDGSVAIHSVLQDASAPRSYDYELDLPEGATLHLSPDSGGVTVVGADGTPILFVGAPWAKDANGETVPTHYSVNGTTLTQHIEVSGNGAFPVVADPWLGIDLVSSMNWTWVAGSGWRLNVNPTPWARTRTGDPLWIAIGAAGYNEIYNKLPASQRSRLTISGEQQYQCHVGFAAIDPQWNMEMWKPRKDLVTQWIGSSCN